MGLTTLPKVGEGENLGVVKQDKPLELIPENRKIKATEWNANAAALEAVCAEVGLHDGSTSGSLVERVTALESGGGTGDVVGPASATDNAIATFDLTTGKLIQDSGVDIGAIQAAQDDATQAISAADTAQATASDALSPLVQSAHTTTTRTLASTDAGDIIPLDAASNAITVTIPHTLFAVAGTGRAFKCALLLVDLTNAVTLAGSGGLSLTYYGRTTFAPGDIVRIIVESATVCRVEVERSGDAFAEVVTSASGGLTAGNVVVGTGGRDVEDSGVDLAGLVTIAIDALFPLVQTAHTSATKTLAAGDAGDIIPLDAASNAIEVTIPHTLFAAGGTGRAWVCQCKVVSVAGGAITFVGSGGIVVSYSGKNPGTDAYIAGDWLTIVVDSATTASIFAVEAL